MIMRSLSRISHAQIERYGAPRGKKSQIDVTAALQRKRLGYFKSSQIEVYPPRSATNYYVVELKKKYYQAFSCLLIVLWAHQSLVARQKGEISL